MKPPPDYYKQFSLFLLLLVIFAYARTLKSVAFFTLNFWYSFRPDVFPWPIYVRSPEL